MSWPCVAAAAVVVAAAADDDAVVVAMWVEREEGMIEIYVHAPGANPTHLMVVMLHGLLLLLFEDLLFWI